MSDKDPLDALLVDGEAVDRNLIVSALDGTVGVGKSGEVVHLPGFSGLNARKKLLATLLGYKASHLLEKRDSAAIGATDLARSSGVNENTVYPTIRALFDDRLVSQDDSSKYFIAHHQVRPTTDELTVTSENAPPKPRRAKKSAKRSAGNAATKSPASSSPGNGEMKSKTNKSAQTSAKKKSASNSAFSPSSAIRDLIDTGFFNEPKDLGQVRDHLKNVDARDVPVTTLSSVFTRLLRSGDLKRNKKDDGKYEYRVPGGG